jgi:branched-chain amino acid transport system permease protein
MMKNRLSFQAILLLIAVAGFGSVPIITTDQYLLHAATMVLLYAYLASAWNIIGGFAGQLALGHAAYFGIGAYTSTLLTLQWQISPWIGLLPAGLAAALIGFVLGYPSFKVRGPYFALTTIAFAGIFQIWVMDTETLFGLPIRGARGLMVPLKGNDPAMFQFMDKTHYYWIILIGLIALLYATHRLRKARAGYYMLAVRGDEDAAAATGINILRTKLLANILSAFFTGLAGVFYAQLILFVDPGRVLGIDLSVEIALLGIIGGRGTVWGPLLGAFLLRPVSEIIQAYLGGSYLGVHLSVYGLILMAAVLYMPQGIYDLLVRGLSQMKYPRARKEEGNRG